jgi:ubiquinone/menaquinone biosynthesis C-methylase UbiE
VNSSRRERESSYWNSIAEGIGMDRGRTADNIYKRQLIVGKLLLACDWANQRVLEIGVGAGQAAMTINVMMLGRWKFTGTELSELFFLNARDNCRLNMVRTDVTNLPGNDGEYTRVMCLDSLEHVHPEDRDAGYKEIARVTAKGGFLLINMPLSRDQFHDIEFDHPFGMNDLHKIEQCGFRMISFDRYVPRGSNTGTEPRPSGFVVMERE